ncbi:MAG: site-specific integrase, partial [Desulfobacteraceae bacterium]|nr:site-specific integrase [Desulfobacteraceae bacterium]
MRGHIVKRGKSSYSIVISLGKDITTGKYKYQWETVKGTKKEAEKRLAELLHQIDTGTYMKPAKTTLAEFLQRWLKDYVWPNLAPRTAEGYDSIIRQHLIPGIGAIPLIKLNPEQLQRYYSEKLANGRCDGQGALGRTTVSHHHTCLHRALSMALKWGLISRNPADAVTPPRPQRPEIQTMNENEVQTFLKTAKETPYHALFYLALFTGMRRSELLALRWCDVNLDMCEVSVTRSLHLLRDGTITIQQPKTARAHRQVALPPSATLMLKAYKEQQALEYSMLGVSLKGNGLVFSHHDGRPLLPNSVSHAWVKIVKRAGLKHFRMHDAR